MLMMFDRAMVVVRRVTRGLRIVIVAGMLHRVHGKYCLARIRSKGTPLQADQYAERHKPCEEQSHLARGTWH